MTFNKLAVIVVPVVALAVGACRPALAGNLVANGDFSSFSYNTGTQYPGSASGGQMGYNVSVDSWSTTGYNFLFAPGVADTTGVNSQFGNLQLWGPNNSNPGDPQYAGGPGPFLPASSPDGGNYLAADGAYDSAPITQTINSLTVGQTYQVGFYWAGAQQYTFSGPNTEQWVVDLGNSPTQATAVYDNPSHGFSGWMYQTFDFTATATSEVLSFLAVGTPISPSVPPMSLLDGVSVNAVPEPSGLLLMGIGVIGTGVVYLRRRVRGVGRGAASPSAAV